MQPSGPKNCVMNVERLSLGGVHCRQPQRLDNLRQPQHVGRLIFLNMAKGRPNRKRGRSQRRASGDRGRALPWK